MQDIPAKSLVNLAAEEPYLTSFDVTVRSVDGCDVILDCTYFYAEGGGQPADRGVLARLDWSIFRRTTA